MKVLVPVKRVVDYNVKIRVKADGSGVELLRHGDPFFEQLGAPGLGDRERVFDALRLREEVDLVDGNVHAAGRDLVQQRLPQVGAAAVDERHHGAAAAPEPVKKASRSH